MRNLQVTAGQKIEDESFQIIRREMGEHAFTGEQLPVAVRVIHATADFDFVDALKFHPKAIQSGVEALRKGAQVITDVRMVQVGVSARLLAELNGSTRCLIAEPEIRRMAQELNVTRSVAAMRYLKDSLDGGIVAIGNAPTALFEVIRLVQEEGCRPALIVGVPVGFVNTVESKAQLAELDVPYITALGRKGGSTVAVAIVNALLRVAAA